MTRGVSVVGLCLIVLVAPACVSVSARDRAAYRKIRAAGLADEIPPVKSPLAAGILNTTFGMGNMYLAMGTDQQHQWVLCVVNFLLWPVSMVWGIPEAAVYAGRINRREVVDYYRNDPYGKKRFKGVAGKDPSELRR